MVPGPSFSVTRPNVARVYDYLLGGKDSFAADREAAGKLLQAIPESALVARQNREFLRRVVEFLAGEAGVRQFLDLGSGLPAMHNVHEVARAIDPGARVAYADFDPVVCAHGNALLAGDNVVAVQADMRNPRRVLDDPGYELGKNRRLAYGGVGQVGNAALPGKPVPARADWSPDTAAKARRLLAGRGLLVCQPPGVLRRPERTRCAMRQERASDE